MKLVVTGEGQRTSHWCFHFCISLGRSLELIHALGRRSSGFSGGSSKGGWEHPRAPAILFDDSKETYKSSIPLEKKESGYDVKYDTDLSMYVYIFYDTIINIDGSKSEIEGEDYNCN